MDKIKRLFRKLMNVFMVILMAVAAFGCQNKAIRTGRSRREEVSRTDRREKCD